MKLLNVNMSLDPVTGGGTADRCLQMSRFLKDFDVETTLLTTDIGVMGLRADDLSKFRLVALPCLNRRFYVPRLSYRRAIEFVRAADIVHLMNHWTYLNALIGHIALRLKKPYVVCPAGALPIYGRSRSIKQLYNFAAGKNIIRCANAQVAVSPNEAVHYARYGVSPEKVVIIPNGIDFSAFTADDVLSFRSKFKLKDFPFILFVGRLNHIKGPDLLLRAFNDVKDQIRKYHLVYIGPDGGMLDILKKITADFALEERVHFLGYLGGSDKSQAYHAADLLVIPSRQEAMSIVVLEAGITGTPVLLTDQCGFDDVEEIGGGRVVAASVAGLQKGLSEMSQDPARRIKMGEKLKDYVLKHYGWDQIARKYVKLFEQVLKNQHPSHQ